MNARIKLSARAALAGSQLKIITLVTAVMFLSVMFSLCNAAMNIFFYTAEKYFLIAFAIVSPFAAVAAIGPLCLLLEIRHLLLAKGINPIHGVKIGVSGALKACIMCITLFALKLFWFLVFEALPILGTWALFAFVDGNALSLKAFYALLAGAFALASSGLIFYFWFIQRYSKAMFYIACFKDLTVAQAIEESIRKTKNKLADIFLFKLSFMPWFLLCAAVIPALFVIPYYKQSITCYFLSNR